MLPPIPCWPDQTALTYHYNDLSVQYVKDPVTGVYTPPDRVPSLGLSKITLWIRSHPLLEVKVDSTCQIPLFKRVESDKPGIAKYYLIGWKQLLPDGSSVHCAACYVPPNSSSPGRIVVRYGGLGEIADKFFEPEWKSAPAQCWPDTTSYTFHYEDGVRRDRISIENGEELTSEKMPREKLRKIILWHHELPVVECHYQPGQRALFRRRNEYQDSLASVLNSQGVPLEGMMASSNWFAFKKAERENKYRAIYMLGCSQEIKGRDMQMVTYYFPQNGQVPPRVILAGRFKEDGQTYLPIPVGFDDNVIT
jgi:hypothetical protein